MKFTPISKNTMRLLSAPTRFYFKPVVLGLENLKPGGPYLFVGNHTIYGVMDVGLYAAELYIKKDIYLRGLGDFYHFKVPGWGDFLKALGAVVGTPEECSRLMREGWNVVVFPGGGREVCKRKGEAYKLIWKDRTGFARLAIEHGYEIVPFASVGPENAFSILADADDLKNSRLGRLLTEKGVMQTLLRDGEAVPPLVRGIGPTMIPRPEKFYTRFGAPVSTAPLKDRAADPEAWWEVRRSVESEINRLFGRLLLYREQDTDKGLLRRILTRL